MYFTTNLNQNVPSLINSLKDFQIDATQEAKNGIISFENDFKGIDQIEEDKTWEVLHIGKFNF